MATGCEYSDPSDYSRVGEDRRVIGIYEARDAGWVPLRAAKLSGYQAAAQPASHTSFAKWLPPDLADRWPDQLSGLDAPAALRLERITTFELGCRGIQIHIEHGRVVKPASDPCDAAKADHITFSDGLTLPGWSSIVVDTPESREIYVREGRGNLRILQRVLREGFSVKRLGNPAEPDWLWVDGSAGTRPAELYTSINAVKESQTRLFPSTGVAKHFYTDTLIATGEDCFIPSPDSESGPTVRILRNCPQLRNIGPARVSGDRVFSREGEIHQVLPRQGQIRDLSPDGRVRVTRTFQPPLVNAVLLNALPLENDWLAQWKNGTQTWLSLHDNQGRALTAATAAGIPGDLIFGNERVAPEFLTWKDGVPYEVIRARLAIEWRRQ